MKEAIISACAALLGTLVGAGIAIWQTRAQSRSGSALQRERAREELKLDLYHRLRAEIDVVSDTLREVTSYVAFLPATFTTYCRFTRDGIRPAPIKERALELLEMNSAFGRAHSRLVQTLEDFEIVEPNTLVFHHALLTTSYDLLDAFQPMYRKLSMYLPVDLPPDPQGNRSSVFPAFPSEGEVETLAKLIQRHYEVSLVMDVYLYDLRRESQSILLGDLFGTKLAPRMPEDPDAIVLTADPVKAPKLIRHFEAAGNWGGRASLERSATDT